MVFVVLFQQICIGSVSVVCVFVICSERPYLFRFCAESGAVRGWGQLPVQVVPYETISLFSPTRFMGASIKKAACGSHHVLFLGSTALVSFSIDGLKAKSLCY